MILLLTIFLPSKRSSGQVECNSQRPAIFLSRNFSTKSIFCSQKRRFFYNILLWTQIIHISKPCREIFLLLKFQQMLPDLLFSLNELFSSISPVVR